MRRARPSIAGFETAALAVCVLLLGCGRSLPSASGTPETARREVHVDLPSDGGALVSLPLSGHMTVIDAWAPSCVPCRKKVPALVKRSSELEAAGAKLVLVAVLAESESTDEARSTLASWGVTTPFLVDRGDVLRREAGVTDLPATLILAPDGEVRWVAPAGATDDDVVTAARSIR